MATEHCNLVVHRVDRLLYPMNKFHLVHFDRRMFHFSLEIKVNFSSLVTKANFFSWETKANFFSLMTKINCSIGAIFFPFPSIVIYCFIRVI